MQRALCWGRSIGGSFSIDLLRVFWALQPTGGGEGSEGAMAMGHYEILVIWRDEFCIFRSWLGWD